MGRRGGTESIGLILLAFLQHREWKQAELAPFVGVERKTLVRILHDLHDTHLQPKRAKHGRHVYWSVPENWFPGGAAFVDRDLVALARVLHRAPHSDQRERLLDLISRCAPKVIQPSRDRSTLTRPLNSDEEARLDVLQDSVQQRTVVRINYFNGSHIEIARLSVHRIALDSGQLIATSHRDNRLKWFWLGGIVSASLDSKERYRPADDAAIEAFSEHSVDAHHSGAAAICSVFRVPNSEVHWMQARLPFATLVESDDTIEVTTHTSGLSALARLIIGLGDAVTIETPELRRAVADLAQAALDAHR